MEYIHSQQMMLDFTEALRLMGNQFEQTQNAMQYPHVLMKPKVYWDGNHWCCQLGDDITGIVGLGNTPAKACAAFDAVWWEGDRLKVAAEFGKTPVGE